MSNTPDDPGSSDEPELEGYEPTGPRPLRTRRAHAVMRVVVVAGIAGLVLPGALTTINLNLALAARACAVHVAYQDPSATGSEPRFELFGPVGIGWQCYTVGAYGSDRDVAYMGLIPTVPPVQSPGMNPPLQRI